MENTSPCRNEPVAWALTGLAGIVPPLTVLALAVFLLLESGKALAGIPAASFFGQTWAPLEGQFGLLPIVAGTFASTALALLIAVPIGLAAALHLSLYANRKFKLIGDTSVALLGGLPSVVIGLWGMNWIVPLAGNSLGAATLVLALMITPTFTLLAGAAIRQVPADVLETVHSLGVSEAVTVRTIVRHARWGIAGAAILAACRGIGEAIAVSMVAGNVAQWPGLTEPVATLTTTLIVEFDPASGLHRDALYLLAALTMGVIVVVSIAGRSLEHARREHD